MSEAPERVGEFVGLTVRPAGEHWHWTATTAYGAVHGKAKTVDQAWDRASRAAHDMKARRAVARS